MKDTIVENDGMRPNLFVGKRASHWPKRLRAFKIHGYEACNSLKTHINTDRLPKYLEKRHGSYLKGEGRGGGAAGMLCLASLGGTLGTIA